jgi:hypothetical protein
MSDWSGVVNKTSSRDWGSKTLYSWQVEGANLWFRSDFDPELSEGDAIEFSGESPNKITTINKISKEQAKAKAEAPPKRDEAPPTNSPDYWRWKQMHDLEREELFLWRDARADAVRVITTCLAHDQGADAKASILTLGTKKAGRLDVLTSMINELAQQFVEEAKEKVNG